MIPDKMIDIHSHALWGMDDGAGSFDECLDMCLYAEDNGTSVLFLTPHLMYWEQAEDLYDIRNEKIAVLEEELSARESSLVVKPGFEILCDDDIFSIKHFAPYTLCNSKYILIEFNFTKTSEADVTAWCDYLKSFGLVPVIAHPERYDFVMDDAECLNRLSEQGVLFQINAGSVAGDFGEKEMLVASQMLNNGFVDFIGSDAHRIRGRDTNLAAIIEDFPYGYDAELLVKAAVDNPKFIIENGCYFPERKKYMAKL